MSAHTPGPWDVVAYGFKGKMKVMAGSMPVASIASANQDASFNARLIASAPDLLAACQAQHHALDVLMARLIAFDPEFMPTSSRVWPAVVAGSEAIAKVVQP